MDNVFIGSNTTILNNVRIGPNVIIAAGSLINKDVPPNSIVGGVPARVIGNFDEYVAKRKNNIIPLKFHQGIKKYVNLYPIYYGKDLMPKRKYNSLVR